MTTETRMDVVMAALLAGALAAAWFLTRAPAAGASVPDAGMMPLGFAADGTPIVSQGDGVALAPLAATQAPAIDLGGTTVNIGGVTNNTTPSGCGCDSCNTQASTAFGSAMQALQALASKVAAAPAAVQPLPVNSDAAPASPLGRAFPTGGYNFGGSKLWNPGGSDYQGTGDFTGMLGSVIPAI